MWIVRFRRISGFWSWENAEANIIGGYMMHLNQYNMYVWTEYEVTIINIRYDLTSPLDNVAYEK